MMMNSTPQKPIGPGYGRGVFRLKTVSPLGVEQQLEVELQLAQQPEQAQIPPNRSGSESLSFTSPTSRYTASPPARTPVYTPKSVSWDHAEQFEEASGFESPTSPSYNTDSAGPSNCAICNRPVGHLVCNSCGHTRRGRIQKPCKDHPKIIQLMDLKNCPNCLSTQVDEYLVTPTKVRGTTISRMPTMEKADLNNSENFW